MNLKLNLFPTPEQLQKLNTLANFLDDLPHDRFHMPKWCSDDATESSCGTAGCAAGWAATIFHKEGFCFNNGDPCFSPCYNGFYGEIAFAMFFGIPFKFASWITISLSPKDKDFLSTPMISYMEEYNLKSPNDITPKHAADRIRKVIKIIDPAFSFEQPSVIPVTV